MSDAAWVVLGLFLIIVNLFLIIVNGAAVIEMVWRLFA